ncbi:M50 family metallopeptidase [Bacillus sp. C1]
MDILKRPLFTLVAAFVCSNAYIWIRPDKMQVFINMWGILVIGVLVLAIHELGHVVFGLLNGLEFSFMAVGPIMVRKEREKIRIRENKMWLYFGGVAMLLPPSIHIPNLSKKWAWTILGGPLTSFVFSILSCFVFLWGNNEFVLYFAMFHFVIFLATAIPLKGRAFYTDGKQFLILIKADEKAERHLQSIRVMSELCGSRQPKDWDHTVIERSKEQVQCNCDVRESMSECMLMFYYTSATEGMEKGIACLDHVLQIPVTKENKYFVGGFHSWYIVYKALHDREHVSLEDIKKHVQAVPRLDLYQYYRAHAILKYVEKDRDAFHAYMKKAEKEMKDAEKMGFGYLQLEREWFQCLQQKLVL